MIHAVTGNLLEANVQALVNAVNTVGVMGKGIALQFRIAFPRNYELYRAACGKRDIVPGRMFVVPTNRPNNPKFIVNFPTKRHWKDQSRIHDIDAGLNDLVDVLAEKSIRSIAIPPLGCGNGGLKWSDVRPRIVRALGQLPDVEVLLYDPEGAPRLDARLVR
jgi:O-acetyl-ADP-ribose deacetylase (regulator of RNase III)